jgi:outer membrane protein OmpA-like peptidoglycan-associated protein
MRQIFAASRRTGRRFRLVAFVAGCSWPVAATWMGCGPSVRPALVQQALDDAQATLQAAQQEQSEELAGEHYRKAERLLAEAVRQQQKGNRWESYYLARRAEGQSQVSRAVAEEARALQRVELARQGYVEAELEGASLRVQTEETRRRIAEIHRARADADAARSRREATATSTQAAATQQQAARDVQRAHAETELDKARFLADLAVEADAATYDPDGNREVARLLDEARGSLAAGDFAAARVTALEAYRVANETRLTALTRRDAARQQSAREHLQSSVRAALEIGKATALHDVAQQVGAPRFARQPFDQADSALKQAQAAQRAGAFDDAVRFAIEAQLRAEEARKTALVRQEQERARQEREQRVALVRDTLHGVRTAREGLDEFVRRLSAKQLEFVDGLVRLAEKSLQEGNIVLAEVNADRAKMLVQEATQYAKDAAAAEADIVEKARAVENAQAFTTERGVVLRLAGDLFPVNRTDLNAAFFPSLSKIGQIIRPYSSTYRVVVEGHTDRSGDPGANLRLSKGRAATLARHLADFLGTNVSVVSEGYGDTQPIPNVAPADVKNRRIEIIVLTRERS